MMKIFSVTCILATLAIMANCAHHGHHSHAPIASPTLAPSTDCSSVIYNMASCVPFLSVGSHDTKPTHDCCSGLESVQKFNPNCVCVAIKSSAQLGVNLNLTQAMALPPACGVHTTTLSQCGISLPPGTAPGPIPKSPKLPAPVASPVAGEGAGYITQVPAPSPSGAHSMSTSFGVFIGMLVASFSYISM